MFLFKPSRFTLVGKCCETKNEKKCLDVAPIVANSLAMRTYFIGKIVFRILDPG